MCGQYASTRVCTQCCKLGNQPPNFNPSQFVHVVGPRKRAGNARTARGVTLNLSPPHGSDARTRPVGAVKYESKMLRFFHTVPALSRIELLWEEAFTHTDGVVSTNFT